MTTWKENAEEKSRVEENAESNAFGEYFHALDMRMFGKKGRAGSPLVPNQFIDLFSDF